MAIWSLEGNEKQVRALRTEIRDLLIKDESMKRAWEVNYEDKWIEEAKERGSSETKVDKGAMEREWIEEVELPTRKTKTGGNEYLSPIHVKALAVITGKPIIVVAMNDDKFPTMEAAGQFGGIYRAYDQKRGEVEERKKAVVLGYANGHFGTIVKWPGAQRAQSVQIGQKGRWKMRHQFDGTEDDGKSDFLYAVEDREGKVWADMYMGGRETRDWSTNETKMKGEEKSTVVKKEPGDRGRGEEK